MTQASKCFVGIDPGQKGGIAMWFIGNGAERLELYNMPILAKVVDKEKLLQWLVEARDEVGDDNFHVALELSQTMPKQGIVSAHNYGRHNGILEALIYAATGKEPRLPRPQEWQRVAIKSGQINGSPKERALLSFKTLFPAMRDKVPDKVSTSFDGPVDAALIAYWLKKEVG